MISFSTYYFGIQAKRGKLDAAGRSKGENIAEVVNQLRMMLSHPVWDPEKPSADEQARGRRG